jgi:cytochrome P450
MNVEETPVNPDEIKRLSEQFDHASESQMRNPYPMYEAFRKHCPVGRSAQYGGFNFVATYAGAKKVFEDYVNFTSTDGVGIPPQPVKMYPIDLDPPLQTRYRKILNTRFTVEAVATKSDRIEAKINELIDGFIAKGSADLAAELVRPLLPAIVLPILGVPYEDQPKVSAWIDTLTRKRASDLELAQKTGQELAIYLMTLVATRRAAPPADDVLGLLLTSNVDGKALTDDDIFRVIMITLFGGLDTTSAVMLESLLFLARNPEEKRKLASGERNWATAIEEFVRFTSPIQGLRRNAARDVEIEGHSLKQGDWVFGLHGAANRDPAVFAEPDRCLLDRSPNPHVAFGAGAHICLGRNLARLEIEILLKAVLARLGDYRTPADFEPEYFAGEARGMKALPVTFTASAAQA